MTFFKLYFGLLDWFFPSIAIREVYKIMSNPRVRKLRESEEEILNNSDRKKIKFKQFNIQSYTWGDKGSKIAFLIHGWEGQAGNLVALVELLLRKGYQVIAFDAPSHGRSSRGKTNMFEFVEFVEIMLKEYHPDLIISHSFGSVIAAIALKRNKDIQVNKWILVTTPNNFKNRLQDISDFFGITDKTRHGLIKMIEKDTNESIENLNMVEACKNLKNVSEAIIVHSKNDKVLSIDSARKVNKAFPRSELIELDELGHYSILWSEELKEILSLKLN